MLRGEAKGGLNDGRQTAYVHHAGVVGVDPERQPLLVGEAHQVNRGELPEQRPDFFWQVHDDHSMIPSARGVKQTPAHHTTATSKLARNRLPVVVTDRSMGTHFNLRPRAAAAAASPAETFVSNEAASTDRNCLYRPMSRHPNLSRTP
jgi:hypothetical protein